MDTTIHVTRHTLDAVLGTVDVDDPTGGFGYIEHVTVEPGGRIEIVWISRVTHVTLTSDG